MHTTEVWSGSIRARNTDAHPDYPWNNITVFPDLNGPSQAVTNPLANLYSNNAGGLGYFVTNYAYTRGVYDLRREFDWFRVLRAYLTISVTSTLGFPFKLGVWMGRYDMDQSSLLVNYTDCRASPQFREYTIQPLQTKGTGSTTIRIPINIRKTRGMPYDQWVADETSWTQGTSATTPPDPARVKVVLFFGSPDVPIGIGNRATWDYAFARVTMHQVWQTAGPDVRPDPATYAPGLDDEEEFDEAEEEAIAANTEGIDQEPLTISVPTVTFVEESAGR